MKLSKSDPASLQAVIKSLCSNSVVIIPTDTVYGFSGKVPETDCLIRNIKGREETKPFIQLIGSPEDIFKITDIDIPKTILKKWPGALTIIVPKKDCNETVAVRCPDDKWLRQIITQCGFPIYSTSVNRSGKPVFSSPDEISNEFESEVSLFVDDGEKTNAKPSTIIKLANDGSFCVIRQGDVQV